jgi:hypothetical protein
MKKFSTFIFLAGCATQSGDSTEIQLQAALGGDSQDTQAPIIAIDSPMPGEWSDEDTVTVTGRVIDIASGIASATINGNVIPLEGSGRGRSFEAPVTLSAGVNIIMLTATDIAGNSSEKVISIMGNAFQPSDESIPSATFVELNEPMMDAFTEPMSNAFSDRELVQGGLERTAWSDCAVFEGNITSISVGAATSSVTPSQDGLEVTADFATITAEYSGIADICGVEEPFTVTFSHTDSNYTAMVGLSVEDGSVAVETGESSIDITGATISSDVDEYLADHGISIDDMDFETMFSEAMVARLDATPEQAIPGALSSITPDAQGFEAIGNASVTYDIDAVFSDGDGIALSYEASIVPDENAINTSRGAVITDNGKMTRNADVSVNASASVHLINRIVHAGWESGAIGAFVDAEDKGLTVQTWPTMPPVMTRGETPTIRMGELHVEVHNDKGMIARLNVQAQADITFDIDDDGKSIMVATVTDSYSASLSGTAPDAISAEIEEAIQSTFDAALPRFAAPNTSSMALESSGSESAGRQGGWVSNAFEASPW